MMEIERFNHAVTGIKTASPLGGQAIMWVYAYRVGDVLIDAGCWNAVEELRSFAQKHPVTRVFVTHNHEDHYGGSAAFLPQAEVFAGPVTLKSLHEPYSLPEFFQFVWGLPKPVAEAQEFTDPSLEVGDLTLEVVNLSGHCEEMIGFWEPVQRWFFSSDAVPLPSRKQMAMPEENIPMMIQRMHEIQAKNPDVLFDGHRGPIINPQEHIATRIRFLSDLQNQVQERIADGKSISEIKGVFGFPEPWYLPNTEGRFGVEHLIRSLAEDRVE
jgi:glyoxylase-like metal-dependent hydrolase (beta-lactamase superfamily II)